MAGNDHSKTNGQDAEDSPLEGSVHFDFGFGSLFKGLGDFMKIAGEMAEKGQTLQQHQGTFRGPGKAKGVYGVSIRMGGSGPVVEPFGNIRETDQGPEIDEIREPLIDVFDETDHVLVVAEIPGVQEDQIQIEVKEDILSLNAQGKSRKYAKEILLPATIVSTAMQKNFQNGILEIRLEKASAADGKNE